MIVANIGGFTTDAPLLLSQVEVFMSVLQIVWEIDLEGVELLPQTMALFPWHFGVSAIKIYL